MNQLLLGDNLAILRQLPEASVDLVYLDPPFFSNRTYEVIWGDAGERRSFEDRWSGGMMQYIEWLRERVEELHRVLKPTGSLFLHCDWHADAYIKIHILDRIFGLDNFRAEIVWQRTNAHSDAKKKLAVVNDAIYYYAKSEKSTYHPVYVDHTDDNVATNYTYNDHDGRGPYRRDNMASPNPRANLTYDYKGYPPPPKGWRYSRETMEKLDAEGRVYFPTNKDGSPALHQRLLLKRYLNEQKGTLIHNMWLDLPPVHPRSNELIGYPTQKPLALLDRIIRMASNEGDLILDPFVGGGTTVVAAERARRRWVGIDQSVQAVKVTEGRLLAGRDLFSKDFEVRLHTYAYEDLFSQDPFQFEDWLVRQYGGTPNAKKRGDLGLDGRAPDGAPVQVKQQEGVGRNVVDNFRSAAERADAAKFQARRAAGQPVGYILAFSFNKGAVEEAARLRATDGVRIDLVKVEDIVPLARRPRVALHAQEAAGPQPKKGRSVCLTATAEDVPAGVGFYQWDVQHDPAQGFRPTVLLDKGGVLTLPLAPGSHRIAVKVVDAAGLEGVALLTVHVNGGVRADGA